MSWTSTPGQAQSTGRNVFDRKLLIEPELSRHHPSPIVSKLESWIAKPIKLVDRVLTLLVL